MTVGLTICTVFYHVVGLFKMVFCRLITARPLPYQKLKREELMKDASGIPTKALSTLFNEGLVLDDQLEESGLCRGWPTTALHC
jgi:hypothetical protein